MSYIKIYLSGAMEKVNLDEEKFHGRGWREQVKEFFVDWRNVKIIDPYDFEQWGDIKKIVEGDKQAILNCDYFIINTGHEGVGTPMECLFAWEQNKPIFGFGGSQNPWYKYHITEEYEGLDNLLNELAYTIELYETGNRG